MNIKKPLFEEVRKKLKKKFPDSKFNENHLNWYRNTFAKKLGVKINMALETPEHRKKRLRAQLGKARESLKEKNPVMYAKTLPKKERKAFVATLEGKVRKEVLKALKK